ncbi:hypothetical protein PENSUB_77 [Penicillium subrubescens]|uniref:Lipocalin-like domain-containing protein n=1 Tax=Penicillium subrubescens TaxID=1316194 RepID=A0A1Q5UP25_9EURO|nr:hypothetical protein PENSUB_77 [Penicillium subrubescens]
MAAPSDIKIENLTGTWMLDKQLSTDSDPLLALVYSATQYLPLLTDFLQQGVNWVVRKAIGMTEVTMKMKQFEGSSPGTGSAVTQIAISQTANVNLGGTSESRYLDWQEYPQEDHIFGKTVVQSRFIGNSNQAAKSVPCVHIRTEINDPEVLKFLRGEIDESYAPCDGFLVEKSQATEPLEGGEDGLWIHVVIRSHEPKWIAEQASDGIYPSCRS